jgi:hypothetical protein
MNPSTSDKHMEDIRAEAEKQLHIVGQEIRSAQAVEAGIIMEFRAAEFTAINSTKQWKESFSHLFEKLRYLFARFENIRRNTAARFIQRVVWRKLFLWDPRSHRPPNPYDPRSNEFYVSTVRNDHEAWRRGANLEGVKGGVEDEERL